jgi:hypothetical protein
MKYNIDADHLKALFEEMSNDAGKPLEELQQMVASL